MHTYLLIFPTHFFRSNCVQTFGNPRTSATGLAGCTTWAADPRCCGSNHGTLVYGDFHDRGYPKMDGL